MKKIAIVLGLMGVVAMSHAQGYVTVTGTFQNSTNTTALSSSYTGGAVNNGTFGTLGATSTGQSYVLALLTTSAASPSTQLFGNSAAVNTWTNTGTLGGNNGFAGRLVISSDYATAAGTAAVGNSQSWMLFAYSSNLGSLSTVLADLASGSGWAATGYVGWSVVGVGAAGAAPSALPLVVTGSPSPLISTGFTLEQVTTVPEPGTIALASLGGASLLLFRRRNK